MKVWQAFPWPSAARAELRALEAESDPELFSRQLLTLGGRLEGEQRPELAAEIYASLSPAADAPTEISRLARERLDAMIGHGASGPRLELLLRHLTRDAADPNTLLALGLGSTVYSLTRGMTLSRLLQLPASWLTRGGQARALASLAGFALEAPSFAWLASLGEGGGGSQGVASSYCLLGALKLSSWASGVAIRELPGWKGMFRPALRQAGTLTGILLGQSLEHRLGLRQESDAATQLTASLALLLQFHVAAGLARPLFGHAFALENRWLDWQSRSPAMTSLLNGYALATASPMTVPAQEARTLQSSQLLMSIFSEGGKGASSGASRPKPELRNWLEKLLWALERNPGKFPPNRGQESVSGNHSIGESGPYRQAAKLYATLAEARARARTLRKAALDSSLDLEFRSDRLSQLPEYLAELSGDPEYRRCIEALEKLIRRPAIAYPLVEGWPDILLEREPPLPSLVSDFYRHDRELRLQAADIYLYLQGNLSQRETAARRGATFFSQLVLKPELDGKFRTYFRQDVWARSYFEAEALLRKAFLKKYMFFASRLPMGSDEARAGVRMLMAPELRRLVEGPGPIPDYFHDPELLLDMMHSYGMLLSLLPSTVAEVERADRVLAPLLENFGERALAGEPQAVEVLSLFASSDPSARAALEGLAKAGNPIARKLLAPLPSDD